MSQKLEKLFAFLQKIFEKSLETVLTGPWGVFGIGAGGLGMIFLILINVWFALLVGVIASVVFVMRVRKQLKAEREEQISTTPHMSRFGIVVGSIAVIAILTAPFAGAFWNLVLCSFINCGPK